MERRSAAKAGQYRADTTDAALTIVRGKGGRTIRAANTARLIESFARAAKRLQTGTAAEASPAGKARNGR